MSIAVQTTRRIPTTKLKLYGKNPRQGNIAAVTESLRAHGQFRALVVREQTMEVLAGNHTLLALRELGETHALCHLIDCTAEQAKRIVLADNRTSDLATYDDQALADLLTSLDGDLDGTGFDEQALDDLLASVAPDRSGDDTEPGEVPAEPITKPGDLWLLGEHRLLCGDATVAADVMRLMDGARANLIVTSPPYASQRAYDSDSGFTPIRPDAYGAWFQPTQASLADILAIDGSFMLNIKPHCENGQRHLYVSDLVIRMVREWGWLLIDEFCWRDTKNGVPGSWPNRLKDAWEPIYHFARGPKIKFHRKANGRQSNAMFDYSPNNATTATGSGLLGVKATAEHDGIAQASNVLEIASASTGGHSAVYPLELPAWFVRLVTDRGDVVLDPFAGAGTTLIAAEDLNRRCYAMEISSGYCDVTINRWERHTGKTATRG